MNFRFMSLFLFGLTFGGGTLNLVAVDISKSINDAEFSQYKEVSLDLLGKLEKNSDFVFLAFGDRPRVLFKGTSPKNAGFGLTHLKRFHQEADSSFKQVIQNLRPSDNHTDFLSLLSYASAVFAESERKQKNFYIMTDGLISVKGCDLDRGIDSRKLNMLSKSMPNLNFKEVNVFLWGFSSPRIDVSSLDAASQQAKGLDSLVAWWKDMFAKWGAKSVEIRVVIPSNLSGGTE